MNPKSRFRTLEGQRIKLRLLTKDDLPITFGWRNKEEIRRWFFQSDVLTEDLHKAWFENYLLKDDDAVYIIEEKTQNVAIGQISLYHIEWSSARAEFGRLMIGRDESRGKGYAKEATRLLLDFSSQELRLVDIYLEVYAENFPAIAIYKASGFSEDKLNGPLLSMVFRPKGFHAI